MRDFAIVTFAVDPATVEALIPGGFEPERICLDDESVAALVSAVAFRAHRLHRSPLHLPLNYVQINYRAYVRRGNERCVWFLGSTVSSPIVLLPRWLFGLPWHRAPTALRTAWDGARCLDYRLQARGGWGAAELECAGSAAPPQRLDGFADMQRALALLTGPRSGYCLRPNGSLLALRVRHAPLEPQLGTARIARFAVFDRLGLNAPKSAPHSVLLMRAVTFDVLAH